MPPFFSILMPNYNKSEYLASAIESVLAQTFFDWELLLIDDCSSDDSQRVINGYLGDKRIRLFLNEKNSGKTLCLRKSIKSARGGVIVEFDSDDKLAPDALSKVAEAYQKNPEAGFVYTQCWYCDENLHPRHLGFSAGIPGGKSNLHANSVVALRTYKKEIYDKTGGYDESVEFAEDIDLILKLEERTKLFFINEPLYFYRILSQSQSHSFLNTRLNRASTALAKLNAYERRLGTNLPNLNKSEISEALFFGIINSVLGVRLSLAMKFIQKQLKINPLFFLDSRFYSAVIKKVKKINQLKKEKPLLGV